MRDTDARNAILSAVRAARPAAVHAPVARTPRHPRDAQSASLLEMFVNAARAADAHVLTGAQRDVGRLLHEVATDSPRIFSLVAELASTVTRAPNPHAAADLTLFACAATLGVAENGAVWFATSDAVHRAALFLAEQVAIVVPADAIVWDLHDAYARIDVSAHSFGAFIAGPSKTADIEQALVVGAHGPRKLTVIVTSTAE